MTSPVRERINAAPRNSWFRVADFGGGNAAELVLSRLARDPQSPLVRAAKGLYFKGYAPDEFFGKQQPSPVDTAVQLCAGRGVGPAELAAAAFLGLTTQVAPIPFLTVTGSPPEGIPGVQWSVRKNPTRSLLNFTEVAVLEVLSLFPVGVEVDWAELVERVAQLKATRKVNLERVSTAVSCERRKPSLRENFGRLLADLAPAA